MIKHFAIDEANGVLILADSGEEHLIHCTWEQYKQGWNAYHKEKKLMQHAFPFLNADDREFLISGTTPEAWDAMFSEGEE